VECPPNVLARQNTSSREFASWGHEFITSRVCGATNRLTAREESAASMDADPAKRPAELNDGQPEKPGEPPASRRAFEDPEDGGRKG